MVKLEYQMFSRANTRSVSYTKSCTLRVFEDHGFEVFCPGIILTATYTFDGQPTHDQLVEKRRQVDNAIRIRIHGRAAKRFRLIRED